MNVPNLQEILSEIAKNLINQMIDFVPRFVSAVVIFVIGLIIAGIIRKVIKGLLAKVGIDKIGDKLNEIDIVKNLNTPIKISSLIAQVIHFFIVLIFAMATAQMLNIKVLIDLVSGITLLIPKLIVSAVILVAGLFIAEALKKVVISICLSFNISAGRILGSIVFAFFLTITIINALSQAGLNTQLLESSFNLIIGGVIFSFAAGYGFASRDILANILSSFYAKNKFKIGQNVRIDDTEGRVISVDSTAITLQTGESTTMIPLQLVQQRKVEILQ